MTQLNGEKLKEVWMTEAEQQALKKARIRHGSLNEYVDYLEQTNDTHWKAINDLVDGYQTMNVTMSELREVARNFIE